MGATLSKELYLAKSLKELCDSNGKETEPVKSANIMHQFGLLYKAKSPEKLSLIRSAGFLNAAIVRQPLNEAFKKDLKDLCSHVLQISGADKTDEDLIEISEEVLDQVNEMRSHTNEQLKLIDTIPLDVSEETVSTMQRIKIELVKRLQDEITGKYSSIMKYISNKCIEIMGTPPCEYAVVGMGSLARKEITPYSDFEHVIVLEEGVQNQDDYSKTLEYFRWFSVIFQIIIINIKETIIRCLAVPLLNDYLIPEGDWFFDGFTKRSISFDGMQTPACKFPLGQIPRNDKRAWETELIKPISEMANYLSDDEDLKNRYHLADILTKTCFVSGYINIYEQFKEETKVVMDRSQRFRNEQVYEQLEEDLKNFDVINFVMGYYRKPDINIKRVVYRSTTLFITALGRLYSIDANSCFDVIKCMLKKNLITNVTAHKLSFAVAVACEVRLKVYMSKGEQDDFVGKKEHGSFSEVSLKQMYDVVGEASLGEYFVTAFALQEAILSKDFENLKQLQCKSTLKFSILLNLYAENFIIKEWDKYARSGVVETQDSDATIRHCVALNCKYKNMFHKVIEVLSDFDEENMADSASLTECINVKIEALLKVGSSSETLAYLKKVVNFLYKCDLSSEDKFSILSSVISAGETLHGYSDSIDFLGQAIKDLQALASESDNAETSFVAINQRAKLKCEDGLYEEAIELFTEGLFLLEPREEDEEDEKLMIMLEKAACYMNLASSNLHIGRVNEAIQTTMKAMEILEKHDIDTASTCQCLYLLGLCYISLKQPKEALMHLIEGLKMHQNLFCHEGNDAMSIQFKNSIQEAKLLL